MTNTAKPMTRDDNAMLASACMSFRHDFGLMEQGERDMLMFTAKCWLEAFRKEGFAMQPAPDTAKAETDAQMSDDERKARCDGDFLGIGYLVDGKYVQPWKVVCFTRDTPAPAFTTTRTAPPDDVPGETQERRTVFVTGTNDDWSLRPEQPETPKRKWGDWWPLDVTAPVSQYLSDPGKMEVKRTKDGLKIRYRVK